MLSPAELDFQRIDTDALRAVEGRLEPYSLMHETERSFVHGLLRHFRPKKALEVGVFAGGGSALILNALRDQPEARLYSVDIAYHVLKIHHTPIRANIPIGAAVAAVCPELGDRWTLYRGRRCEEVLDEIGPGIDCVVLDTAHLLPGELLDFLLILPYTTEDCLFVLHDINLGVFAQMEAPASGPPGPEFPPSCRLLMSAVDAVKIYPRALRPSPFADQTTSYFLHHLEETALPNIGAFTTTARTREPAVLESVFAFLLLRWAVPYQLSYRQVVDISSRLRRWYPESLAAIFDQAYAYNFHLNNADRIRRAEIEGA